MFNKNKILYVKDNNFNYVNKILVKRKRQQSYYITIHLYGIPKSLILRMDWSYQPKKRMV